MFNYMSRREMVKFSAELFLKGSLFLLETLLFFLALFIPVPVVAALLLVLIGAVYGVALFLCLRVVSDASEGALSRNFSLPALLLIFYLISPPDPTLKFAIIVFSAQGLIKTMYMDALQSVCAHL